MTCDCFGINVLSFVALVLLLIIGGIKKKFWSCCGSGKRRANLMYWVRQESEVVNPM
jgi:hypothetical protein